MLKELQVKNFAIIDDISVKFGTGLNILTGETGAGKGKRETGAQGCRADGRVVQSQGSR